MVACAALHIRKEAFGQNMKYGLRAFVNVNRARTSGKVVTSSVYIGVNTGTATPAFESRLGDPVFPVHIPAYGTFLGRISGVGLGDLNV
jgi:hypothetical protein